MLNDLVIIKTLINNEMLFNVFTFITYKTVIRRVEIDNYIVYIKVEIKITKIIIN